MNKKIILALAMLSLTAIFCTTQGGGTPSPTVDVSIAVNATLTTSAQQTEAALPQTGAIAGQLSYPSDFIPPLRVIAFDVVHPGIYYYVDTVLNQGTYEIADIPPGTYHIVSYRIDPSTMAGGYTQMVPCGMQAGCEDHTLVDVVVTAGATTDNINPGDWYAPDGSFPPMP